MVCQSKLPSRTKPSTNCQFSTKKNNKNPAQTTSHLCLKAIAGLDLCKHFVAVNDCGGAVFKALQPLFD